MGHPVDGPFPLGCTLLSDLSCDCGESTINPAATKAASGWRATLESMILGVTYASFADILFSVHYVCRSFLAYRLANEMAEL